jgi:DNA-binding Lrp family transcriptional regulator
MDEKDFRLLAAVHKDARQSYQSIARGVSLSAPRPATG